jgi:ankyrin repeat protein
MVCYAWSIKLLTFSKMSEYRKGNMEGFNSTQEKSSEQKFQNKAFLTAAEVGDEDSVRTFILTNRWDVDLGDKNGTTPLMLAAANGHEKLVQTLILMGRADVNLENNDGDTALSLAIKNGHKKIISTLNIHGLVQGRRS